MGKLKIIIANIDYLEEVCGYKKEFMDLGEEICGSMNLQYTENIVDWFMAVELNRHLETVLEGLVPSTNYFALVDGQIVGTIDIRHVLNDYLLRVGGNIGYAVRKSQRGKGYGKEMLRQALVQCREMGMERVLITCTKGNNASANTILANGGTLENEVVDDVGIVKQRYWIEI